MSTSTCPKCGLTQSSLTGFCKACGTRLKADGPVSAANKPGLLGLGELISTRGLLIVGGVVVGAFLLWLLFGKGNNLQAVDTLPTATMPSSSTANSSGPLVGTTVVNNPVPTTLPATTVPATTAPAPTIEPTTISVLSTPIPPTVPPTVPPTASVEVPVASEIVPTRTLTDTPPITLTVKGIKAEYAYTDRVNPNGPYTRLRADTRADSEPIGMLYFGDTVAILRDDQDKWYQVRVLNSRDATQQGITGWIERWLIDDSDVPSPPSSSPPPPSPPPSSSPPPPPARFGVRIDVNYEGSGNSGQFTSCVAGRVRTANGRAYAGALVNVNNGPKNSFNIRTGGNGIYRVCGLGASHWSVVLKSITGVRLAQQVVGVVYLNGGSQEAIVHFTQR